MDDIEDDGLPELAGLLRVAEDDLRHAIAGPWSEPQRAPGWDGEVFIFTGRDNPKTPGRPLVALRVDPMDETIEMGHAVGVPLPNGRMQWALGEPRTSAHYDFEEGDAFRQAALLDDLRQGIARIADVAMFRGTSW